MKNPLKKLTDKLNGYGENILICICELIVGILVLIRPMRFTVGILVVAGLFCIGLGMKSIFTYFTTSVVVESIQNSLFRGLLLSGGGLYLILQSSWLAQTLKVLTIVYGIALLIMGAQKIQWSVNMKRYQKRYWYLAAISAAIALVLAALVLVNPFTGNTSFWIVLGISLIFEAIVDGVSLYMMMRG